MYMYNYKRHVWGFSLIEVSCVHAGSPGVTTEMGQRSRRTRDEDMNDDGEIHAAPSFQNAFNEALFSASVSVVPAQTSECVCDRKEPIYVKH